MIFIHVTWLSFSTMDSCLREPPEPGSLVAVRGAEHEPPSQEYLDCERSFRSDGTRTSFYLLFGGRWIWLWADERQWFLSTAEFTQSSFSWKHCFLTTQWVTPDCKIITFQFNRPSFCPLKDKGREYFVLALNVLTWQHTRHLRTRTTKLNKQR